MWCQKELILFQIYLIYAERSLEDFYSSGTCSGIHCIFPQLFPLQLTKALMTWRVSLQVYTIN